MNDVHWYAMHNLKSLYYLRSDAAKSAENVNIKIPRINLEDVECISCEGWAVPLISFVAGCG